MTTPEQVPTELVVGDTWEWSRDLADYSAADYTAKWYFENQDQAVSVTASASGASFAASVPASTTSTYKAGRLHWRLVLTAISGGARKSVETGWVDFLPDPAVSGRVDHRSHARRTLEAIEAVLEGRASVDQMAVTLNGRSLSRTPLAELTAFHDRYRRLVRDEEQQEALAAGQASRRRILTRMV